MRHCMNSSPEHIIWLTSSYGIDHAVEDAALTAG
jgi:hypothetical protein